jgi:transcription termination/antitermination protein NusG
METESETTDQSDVSEETVGSATDEQVDALSDAVSEAAEIEELAEETIVEGAIEAEAIEEAAAEDLAEALVEAEVITEAAHEEAERTIEEADEAAQVLLEAGDFEDAEAVLEAGIEEAALIEEVGEAAAEEVVVEAVAEAAILEAAAEEVVVEAVVEAAMMEQVAEEIVDEALEQVLEEEAVETTEAVADTPSVGDDPFKGPGDWYVVHTYAGYENKVKANLESRIHTMQMEGKIFRVHIPMEDVMEIKGGKKQVVQKKVFPGYLLVNMIYDNDSWYVVRNTPGVTGFVSAGTGSKPTPLSKREVEKILAVKKEEVKPTFRLGFEESDVVRIISGPFADFNGTISEINVDQSKLKVLVNIFDRETPVELGFDQVSKV